jgi:hypothetical protein
MDGSQALWVENLWPKELPSQSLWPEGVAIATSRSLSTILGHHLANPGPNELDKARLCLRPILMARYAIYSH